MAQMALRGEKEVKLKEICITGCDFPARAGSNNLAICWKSVAVCAWLLMKVKSRQTISREDCELYKGLFLRQAKLNKFVSFIKFTIPSETTRRAPVFKIGWWYSPILTVMWVVFWPAEAVIREPRALSGIIGRKGCVGGFVSLLLKPPA